MAIIPDFDELDELAQDDWLTGWDLSESKMFKISLVNRIRSMFSWNEITGSGTVTLSNTKLQQLINSGVTQVNLPATPANGQTYILKNASGGTVTLSGNGNNIYTSSENATRTIANGSSYKVIYSDTDSLWYNTI